MMSSAVWSWQWRRGRGDAFLALLLSTDMLLIIGHLIFMYLHLVVWQTPGLLDSVQSDFSIVTERGFAETFQYFKAWWLVVMFVWLARATREYWYLAWATVFLYIGLDDLLEIHEETGNSLALRYGFQETLGLRPRDIGELAIFAAVGLALLALVGVAYLRGSDRFRRHSERVFVLVALLAALGIGVDALHILFLHTWAGAMFGLIEDGGELIVLSVACWYVFVLVRAHTASEA
jgi:hypothetical protein